VTAVDEYADRDYGELSFPPHPADMEFDRVRSVFDLPQSWEARDLATALGADYEPERPTMADVEGGQPLLYAGRVNMLFGESGAGKGHVSLAWAAAQIREGHRVALIDLEDNELSVANRLRAQGLSVDEIVNGLVYIHPEERLSGEAVPALVEYLAKFEARMVIIDTVGEFMAMDAVRPNEDDAVAAWFQRFPRALATAGFTVVLLDHVAKAQFGTPATLFSIGSQRKRAAVNGAAYRLDAKVAPAVGRDGVLELVTAKDNRGARPAGSVAATVKVTSSDDGRLTLDFVSPSPVPKNADGSLRLTGVMEKVSRALEGQSDEVSQNDLAAIVGGNKGNVLSAVSTLTAEGFVTFTTGARGSKLLTSARPYRQEQDELSDRFVAAIDPF
jgi:hypothetical protein